jgi:hypothetical protein
MKKKKHAAPAALPSSKPERQPMFTRQALIYLGSGIVTLIIGYIVLSFANARADNLPGKMSPFLILGGYALVGMGFFFNDRTPE